VVGVSRGLTGLRGLYVLALIVSDVIMLRLAFLLAYRLRLLSDARPGQPGDPPSTYDDLATLCVVVIVFVLAIRRLYIPRRGVGRVDLLYQVSAAVGVGWLASLSFTFFVYRALEPPRLMLVYWALLSIVLVWLTRVVLDSLLREAHRRGRDLEHVLIVGDGEQAQLVEAKIRDAPELGYRVAGFIGHGTTAALVQPVLGGLDDIPRIVREQGVGEVIIAWAGISHQQLVDIVTGCARQRVDIKIFPDIFELMAREVETSELTGLPLMRVRDVALRGWMRLLKRALDVAVSWTLLPADGLAGQADLAARTGPACSGAGRPGWPTVLHAQVSLDAAGCGSRIRPGLDGAQRSAPHAVGWGHPTLQPGRIPAIDQRARG
jgi:hypothetical protein